MNRSYTKIRHMQESNLLLEKRLLSEKTPVTTTKPVVAITQAPTGTKFSIVTPNEFGNAPTKFLDFYVNKVAGDKTGLKRTAQLFGSDEKDKPVSLIKYTAQIPFTKGTSPNFDFTQTVNMYAKDLGKNPDLADELKTKLNNLSTKSPQV